LHGQYKPAHGGANVLEMRNVRGAERREAHGVRRLACALFYGHRGSVKKHKAAASRRTPRAVAHHNDPFPHKRDHAVPPSGSKTPGKAATMHYHRLYLAQDHFGYGCGALRNGRQMLVR